MRYPVEHFIIHLSSDCAVFSSVLYICVNISCPFWEVFEPNFEEKRLTFECLHALSRRTFYNTPVVRLRYFQFCSIHLRKHQLSVLRGFRTKILKKKGSLSNVCMRYPVEHFIIHLSSDCAIFSSVLYICVNISCPF